MNLTEYIILFLLVVSAGAGIPVLGDTAMIAAGTLAGEGRLNIGVVVLTSIVGWLFGSLAGYEIGLRGGRDLLDHPGRLEKRRRKTLAKGDKVYARHNFVASVTMPAYVSGIFRVRLHVFLLSALVSGAFFIGMYEGLSFLFGQEVAKRIGDAGSKAVLGVLVAVVIGLAARAGWSKWRAARQSQNGQERPASAETPSESRLGYFGLAARHADHRASSASSAPVAAPAPVAGLPGDEGARSVEPGDGASGTSGDSRQPSAFISQSLIRSRRLTDRRSQPRGTCPRGGGGRSYSAARSRCAICSA